MADHVIVQKDEIGIGRKHGRLIPRKREREITLLPDCFDADRTPQ